MCRSHMRSRSSFWTWKPSRRQESSNRNTSRGLHKYEGSRESAGVNRLPAILTVWHSTADGSKLYITVQYAEVPGIVVYDVEAETIKKIDTVIAGNHLGVHPRNDKLYFPTRDDRVVVIDTKTDRISGSSGCTQGAVPTEWISEARLTKCG